MALLLFSPAALATDYFVNDGSTAGDVTVAPFCPIAVPGVNAGGCGTCTKPCASLQGLVSSVTLAPGDHVYVNTGRYVSTTSTDYPKITTSGTPAAPIVIEGAQDATGTPLAVLDGASAADTCIWISNASNITLRYLEVAFPKSTNGVAPYGSGVEVDGNSVGILLEHLVAHDACASGCANVSIDAEPPNATDPILSGTIELRDSRIYNAWYGVYIGARVTETTVHHNELHDCSHAIDRIASTLSSGKNLITDMGHTTIRGNRAFSSSLPKFNGCRAAIDLYGARNTLVEANVLYANGCNAITVRCDSATQSGCVNFPEDIDIHGNTAAGDFLTNTNAGEIDLSFCNSASATPLRIHDNVVVFSSTSNKDAALRVDASCARATANYDDVFLTAGAVPAVADWNGTTYATLSAFKSGAGQEARGISADPLFADSTNANLFARNYHELSAGGYWSDGGWATSSTTSPVVDAADPASPLGNEPFFNGGARNLGAFGGTGQASRTPGGQLAFTSAAQQVAAFACSSPVTVSLRGVDGGAAATQSDFELSLTTSGAAVGLFSDSSCQTQLTTATVPAGQSALSFYFSGSALGQATLNVAAPGVTGDSQVETLVDGGLSPPDAGVDGGADAGALDGGANDGGSIDGGSAQDGGAGADGGDALVPRRLQVGCGCGASEAEGLAVPLLLWVLARRRR